MVKKRILLVEDSSTSAAYAQNSLQDLGYSVPSIVSTGEEAIIKAEEMNPDLVLMDIVLNGKVDGVIAAERIQAQFNIPVVFITSQCDYNTFQRAKKTDAFGYIYKPFGDRELNTVIEMALYKHQMERKLKDSEHRLATTLASISDAVVSTDVNGLLIYMNPVVESLTGWNESEALGADLSEVVCLIDKTTNSTLNPIKKVLEGKQNIKSLDHSILISRDGSEIPISGSAAPIRDDGGIVTGAVLVFRDITEFLRIEEERIEKGKLLAVLETAGAICHEMSSPVQSISGYIDLLLKELLDETLIREKLKKIEKLVNRIIQILQKLRNITSYRTTNYIKDIKIIDIHQA